MMMNNNICIVAIFLAVLVSVASAGVSKKKTSWNRPTHKKTQTKCEQVPYQETRMETKDYPCPETVTTQECHDVPRTVPETCFETLTRSEDYDCSYDVDEVKCKEVGKKLRALGTMYNRSSYYGKQAPVPRYAPTQQCNTVSRKVPKTCSRNVPYQESYSCDKTVMENECVDKNVVIQKTCQKEVQVEVPHQVDVTLYKEVCKDVSVPLPPPPPSKK